MRLGWLRISCISPKTARATTRQPQHSESGTGSQSTAPRARRRTQVSTRATFVHDLASRGPSINASSKSAGRGPADTQDRRARAHRRTQVSTRATFVHDLARRGQSINASSNECGPESRRYRRPPQTCAPPHNVMGMARTIGILDENSAFPAFTSASIVRQSARARKTS